MYFPYFTRFSLARFCAFMNRSILPAVFFRSAPSRMLYRASMLVVLCPEIFLGAQGAGYLPLPTPSNRPRMGLLSGNLDQFDAAVLVSSVVGLVGGQGRPGSGAEGHQARGGDAVLGDQIGPIATGLMPSSGLCHCGRIRTVSEASWRSRVQMRCAVCRRFLGACQQNLGVQNLTFPSLRRKLLLH